MTKLEKIAQEYKPTHKTKVNDYVPREAVLELVRFIASGYCYVETPTDDFMRQISEIPAADVTPTVHGKWMKDKGIEYACRCSNCGTYWEYSACWSGFYNYCPKCGADMRVEGKKNAWDMVEEIRDKLTEEKHDRQ